MNPAKHLAESTPHCHQFHHDAVELEKHGLLQRLKWDHRRGGIGLDDMVLIEDDAPGIGRPRGATEESWFERLHKGLIVRKELVLDHPRAQGAWLLFCGREATDNDWPLQLRINDHPLIRLPTKLAHPTARHYHTTDWGSARFDNWFVIPIPVGALQRGTNQILLQAESEEPSWEIMVAAGTEFASGSDSRRRHPGRSARSVDGGITWDGEHLGWRGEISGEYCIRLSLDRYAERGTYRSPSIDVAEDDPALKECLEVDSCQVRWDLDVPPGTGVEVRARMGDSPLADADGWAPWQVVAAGSGSTEVATEDMVAGDVADSEVGVGEVSSSEVAAEGGAGSEVGAAAAVGSQATASPTNPNGADHHAHTWDRPAGRYLQFEVALWTDDPLRTPLLRGIQVETHGRRPLPPRTAPHLRLQRNGRVVRSSVTYTHEDFAALNPLRQRFALDSVVAGVATEFQAQVRLLHWAYTVPLGTLDAYAWNYLDLPRAERTAGGEMVRLGPYERRRRDGHCLYCNLTLVAALLAMGYPARWVNVSTKHTYGHEVAEVWSNDFDKWVFMDATRDYYLCDAASGVPLSLVDISDRLAAVMPAPATWEFPVQHWLPQGVRPVDLGVVCSRDAHPYPVFDPQVGSEDLIVMGHLQMPLRNDFASRATPVPWRLSSNWGSHQFFCWYSQAFPRKREYARHTCRRQDFSPSLNQSQLYITRTEDQGALRVEVDTETPGFACFLVRQDTGNWREEAAASWIWQLHAGLNQLRVKVRNRAGVCGPESCVEAVWP